MSESVNLRGIRTGTPVPRIEREKPVSRPVVTYQLSPEELERYRNMSKPKERETKLNLSKEEYLKLRLQGLNRNQICSQHNVNPGALYSYLEKWGIKSRNVEETLLASMREAAASSESEGTTQVVDKPVDKSESLDYVTIKIPFTFTNEPIDFVVGNKSVTRKDIFEDAMKRVSSAIEWAYRDMCELIGEEMAHAQIQRYVDKRSLEYFE